MTQIFLLAGTTSFPDPGNWNPVNTVEVVGCGSKSSRARSLPPCPIYTAGYGGGSGGYGRGNNRMDPFPVALLIIASANMTGVVGSTARYSNWGDPGGGNINAGNTLRGAVWAGNSTLNGSLGAGITPPNGGAVGGPDLGYTGAFGGNYSSITSQYAGGGAGSGGPHGNGAPGTNAGASAAPGGAADNGTVPGGATAGAAGRSGTQWDPSHGCGSGGAGGAPGNNSGGTGANYGGGAGGCGNTNTAQPNGGDALIIVNYIPYVPPSDTRAVIMV